MTWIVARSEGLLITAETRVSRHVNKGLGSFFDMPEVAEVLASKGTYTASLRTVLHLHETFLEVVRESGAYDHEAIASEVLHLFMHDTGNCNHEGHEVCDWVGYDEEDMLLVLGECGGDDEATQRQMRDLMEKVAKDRLAYEEHIEEQG